MRARHEGSLARTPVIALHCSGADAGQWRELGEALGGRYELVAPEHYGCDSVGPWSGAHAFTLADEAARTLEIIDRSDSEVHLVGHSYGGGVALHAAVERPGRIASIALYEPSAFHLLKAMSGRGAAAFAEIVAIATKSAEGVITGDYRGAAISFVDYWGGQGAWAALRPSVQAALTRWVPKAPLDFQALIDEPTPARAYAGLRSPVLIMRGEHAPRPTRLIAETLRALIPGARLAVIAGAGHMGPLTHASEVVAAITQHIAAGGRLARLDAC
jgi:pimeloyl-ACP methyl ester carboxylesterase